MSICPLCGREDCVGDTGLEHQPYICVNCEFYFGDPIKHFGSLDKIEQEQVKKAVNKDGRAMYRGFEFEHQRFYSGPHDTIPYLVQYEASRDDHQYSFVAPNLDALLHIIWMITKN